MSPGTIRPCVKRWRCARRRIVQSAGAILGIATVAAIAIGFSGQILFKPTAAADLRQLAGRAPSASAVPPAAGIRPSPTPAETCTRTASVDATGATDVTHALQAFLDASPDGSVVCLEPDGQYRVEGQLHLAGRNDLTIDGRGARCSRRPAAPTRASASTRAGRASTSSTSTIEGYWPEAGTADAVILPFEGNHGIVDRRHAGRGDRPGCPRSGTWAATACT